MRLLPRNKTFLTTLAAVIITGFSYAQDGVKLPPKEGKIVINQDERINKLLVIKKELNTSNELDRYRIQIYNGTIKGAEEVRDEFEKEFPDWSCEIRFGKPNYKIWVGKFRDRLEADRHLVEVKKKYPNAFLLEPK